MSKKRANRQTLKLTADVIEARAFVLVDGSGRERATLSTIDGETGSLTVIDVKDDAGRPRITLQVDDKGGSSITLFTLSGGSGVSLAATRAGNGVSIADVEGRPCIMAGVSGLDSHDPRGPGPKLDVLDEDKRRTWSVFDGEMNHAE
jgi:hypothetical protein